MVSGCRIYHIDLSGQFYSAFHMRVQHGILEEIKSDNGLPFNGSKFSNFAQEQGFKH